MVQFIKYVLERVSVVLGALLFLQIPLFMNHYQQQLVGRVAELQWIVEDMHGTAHQTGKSLDKYIQKFTEYHDEDIANQGSLMEAIYKRWQNLSVNLLKLKQTSLVERPFVFLVYLQSDVLHSTLQNFQPGIPVTIEGAMYAFIGMCGGAILYYLSIAVARFCKSFGNFLRFNKI